MKFEIGNLKLGKEFLIEISPSQPGKKDTGSSETQTIPSSLIQVSLFIRHSGRAPLGREPESIEHSSTGFVWSLADFSGSRLASLGLLGRDDGKVLFLVQASFEK